MISRLIDINIKPVSHETIETNQPLKTNFSIKDYAKSFINGMEKTQLKRFKQMLENNIEAGMSVAKSYNIDYSEFIKEVKNELNII